MTTHGINICTLELPGDFTQMLLLPKTSEFLDIIRREVNGICTYTLVYKCKTDDYTSSTFEILFNYSNVVTPLIDRSYNYLTSVQVGYDKSNFHIVLYRRILSDIEKREEKIDHLLLL